ncbi:MAG: SpoIIE family protein phosphatase [Thermoleophilia bacterium]|nr:SpoIIE family protein phosphatase [Thermoleophilia bacterium]
MAERRADAPATGAALARVLFDPGAVTHLAEALAELAGRVRAVMDADLAAIVVIDESDPEHGTTLGAGLAEGAPAGTLAPLLGPGDDLLALPGQATWSGSPVVWPRLLAEAAVLDRLAELAAGGLDTAPLRALLRRASGVAVPLATPNHPRLGAVCLVSLDPARPIGGPAVDVLEQAARQLSLTVRNHQWRDRNRRTRQVLQAVLESTPSAVVVTDLRDRLLMGNRAAGDLLGADLDVLAGEPYRALVTGPFRRRFADGDAYVAETLAALDRPGEAAGDELHTADGRILERYSAPVRDTSGDSLGRVEILTDVTAAREALQEAHRLADEAARLRMLEERRSGEETALARAAHLMAAALTSADVHVHLLDQARELTGATAGAVLRLEHGEVVPVAASGMEEAELDAMARGTDRAMLQRLLSTRRSFMCSDTRVEAPGVRSLVPGEARSFVLVPLAAGDRLHGVLLLTGDRPRAFGARELRLAGELAAHAGMALQNATLFEQEHHVAETLQAALLPDELPRVRGLELAGLYRAAAGSLAGGDFYGAWQLPGGRVAVLVGDVSGKGAEAAGLTAMVRYAAEGLSLHEDDPGRITSALNELLLPRLPDGTFVATALVVIDLEGNLLRWCTAGHPPPLLVSASGALRALEGAGPPCGVFAGTAYEARDAVFEPGDTLFVSTDGLIEARRGREEFGEERLREVVLAGAGAAPRDLARAVHAAVSAWAAGRLSDDVAIAVARRTAA